MTTTQLAAAARRRGIRLTPSVGEGFSQLILEYPHRRKPPESFVRLLKKHKLQLISYLIGERAAELHSAKHLARQVLAAEFVEASGDTLSHVARQLRDHTPDPIVRLAFEVLGNLRPLKQ